MVTEQMIKKDRDSDRQQVEYSNDRQQQIIHNNNFWSWTDSKYSVNAVVVSNEKSIILCYNCTTFDPNCSHDTN